MYYAAREPQLRAQQHAVIDGKWKYINDKGDEYLFDLSKDPGEQQNLRTTEPGRFAQLKGKYETWQKSVLVPLPLE